MYCVNDKRYKQLYSHTTDKSAADNKNNVLFAASKETTKTSKENSESVFKKPFPITKHPETSSGNKEKIKSRQSDSSLNSQTNMEVPPKNWIQNGFGTNVFSDENIYIGNFQNYSLKGIGYYKSKKNNIYIGEFSNNKPNGEGIFIASNGDIYYDDNCENGQFSDSKIKKNLSDLNKANQEGVKKLIELIDEASKVQECSQLYLKFIELKQLLDPIFKPAEVNHKIT